MEDPGNAERLKVIIVGGSIAGLTLAHCLHHNSIDFVVLEFVLSQYYDSIPFRADSGVSRAQITLKSPPKTERFRGPYCYLEHFTILTRWTGLGRR